MSKTKRVKLADVLWEAANRFLEADDYESATRRWYSCEALALACGFDFISDESDTAWPEFITSDACQFLRSLGCDPTGCGYVSHTHGDQRQGVRYMWLLLAMHVAADEDIEVEVQA